MPEFTRREFVTALGASAVVGVDGDRRGTTASAEVEPICRSVLRAGSRRRLLYTSDPSNLAFYQSGRHRAHHTDGATVRSDPARIRDLTDWVDQLAFVGVDAYAQCVFSQGWTLYFRSEQFEYDSRPQHQRFMPLLDSGVAPLNHLIEQTHKRGMEFIAKFRMNDRHGSGRQGASFILNNHRWWLAEFPGGLDYSYKPVRDLMFAAADEIVRRFDVDGLLFNYIRHMHCFPTRVAREQQPVMTDFLRHVRAMLVKRGRQKQKTLSLGVMVPQTLEECHALGYDIPTWIREELIDYVCPCDFAYPDFNAPYEEFGSLTGRSNCHLYPTLSPLLCRHDDVTLQRPEQYRALVQNFYGAGAAGVCVFNYQYHWARRGGAARYPGAPEGYPLALSYLRELKDPKLIAGRPKHYRFHPLWGGRCPTGFVKNDRLVLPHKPGASEEYRFRLYEAGADASRSNLQFSAQGLLPDDVIRVEVNSKEIKGIRQTFHKEGRLEKFGRPLPAFSTVFFDLGARELTNGENQLRVTLTKIAAASKIEIVVDEVEVVVLPG